MLRFRRHRRLLRSALLVLLALGMAIQPALGAMAELHGVEHAVAAQSDHGHGHVHAADAAGHHHHGVEQPSDPDHATGQHGLLHQCASASVALPEAIGAVSPQAPCGPRLPEAVALHLPGDAASLPFRPPIA